MSPRPGWRLVRWLRGRPTGAAALFYAVLSLAMFSPALVPGRTLSSSDMLWGAAPWQAMRPAGIAPLGSNREQVDAIQYFQPFLQTTRATLPHVPLWNPYIMGGRPYLANLQSAVFSPFNLPGYLLPFWRSLALIAVLKLFVAALGTYLLARALGMRFTGALLAGTVFGFSLWMVSWVSWSTTSVWAYIPWLCLLADSLLRRPGPVPFVGVAGLVALQFFGGHPESSFHALLLVSLFWLVRLLGLRPRRGEAMLARALLFGGALAAGTALAALTLIPFVELLNHSVDLDARKFFGPSHAPSRFLFGVFLHDYWGRQTRTSLIFASALEETAYYVGAITLMLTAAALVLRHRAERLAFAAIGAGFLAVAAGIPPFFDVVKHLPGFNTAHNARLGVGFVFCAALLAGWGLDELSAAMPSLRPRRILVGASAALLALPVVVMAAAGTLAPSRLGSALRVAWGFAEPLHFLAPTRTRAATSVADILHVPAPPPGLADQIRMASLLEWLVLGGLGLLLLVLRLRGRLGGTAFAALAIALVAGDLFKAGVGYNPSLTLGHAKQPTTPAIRYLQARRPNRFVALDPKVPSVLVYPIPPDVGMRYRLYDARGYDYPLERRFEHLWQLNVSSARNCLYPFCVQSVDTTPRALRTLGLLSVTDLMQDPRDRPLRLRTAYAGPDARIYKNPYALPRAFLVERQTVVPSDATALASVTSARFPLRSVAVTDRRLPGLAEGSAGATPAPGSARISSYSPERVEVRTRSPRPALMLLTDTYFPGWKATVDGRDATVHRADYLLRAVAVPRGDHTVVLRYRPASWRAGWIISGLTLLVLALVVLAGPLGLARRMRPSR